MNAHKIFHSILDKCAPMCLDIPKLRSFSLPKTLAIFLSGLKNRPSSESLRPCSLMYANKYFMHSPRLASYMNKKKLGLLVFFFKFSNILRFFKVITYLNATNISQIVRKFLGFGKCSSFRHIEIEM